MISSKSGVFARGVVLVAIPIVLHVVFVGWLAIVLANAQEKLQAQWKSEELTRMACQFSRECTDIIVYMQMPVDVKKLMGDDVRDVGLLKPRRDFDLLLTMARPNPRHKDTLEHLETYGKTLFTLLSTELEAEKLRNRKQLGNAMGVNYKVLLSEFGPRFYDAIEDLVHGEEESMADTNSFGAASIASINRTILIIVLLSLAATGLLGYVYAVSIRNPIRHLSENGKRLSSRQPLLPVLPGGDEFAQLDHLLHHNAGEIELALARERAVMENAADMICVIDEEGTFLVVNPFVERLLGYRPDEILEKPVNALSVPEQSLLADEYIRKAINGTEQLFELKLKKRNGEFVQTRWSCIWSDEDKKLFCVVHDVSEEKAIEQLKQDFADMISHDLRSPLMAMGNSLTLIEAGVKGEISREARASLQTSAKNVEKLISLVNDLLDFQKLKAGKMQLDLKPTALEAVIKDAADLVAETAREKGVELDLPTGETMVTADRNKLMQTVVNLISNAIKFSGAPSRVLVQVEKSEKSVSFSVFDAGPGVPPEFQERIFEPFEQAPSRQKSEGTGLGLAICKLVVQAHGGTISCANRAGSGEQSGSIFTVELPL